MGAIQGQSGQILNLTAFEEVCGGDRDLMRELAQLYLVDAEARLPALESASAAGDLEGLGQAAHGLKGMSAQIGAERAASAFRRLEEMGRRGEAEGLADALEVARAAYAETRQHLARVAA
jgi:HPt (histidine-containing phosphotransfer) domain-containing protein